MQILGAVAVILLAGDSLLNLAQVIRGLGLPVWTVCWEVLKWTSIGTFFGFVVIDHEKSAVTAASGRSSKIDQLYAELRPLMRRAANDPGLKMEVESKLDLLRKLQAEEADEMEKLFESKLSLKSGEGWEALHRAEALLARYGDPASQNSPTSQHR
jgi:hypothetical protein